MRGAYKAPVPLPAFKHKCGGGKKVVDTYTELVGAWRVGTVQDYYFGSKSDEDPTVVWLIDGVEFAKADVAGVKASIAEGFARAGIVSVTPGPSWCGYPSVTVEYVSGIVTHESYDGHSVTVESTAVEELIAA